MGKDLYYAGEDMSDENFDDFDLEDDLSFNEYDEKYSDYGNDYSQSSNDEFDDERCD